MPTPFESAQLLLTLYDQRREETLRKARDFFISFIPNSFEDVMAGLTGPHSGYIRMVLTYWDMAASFVKNGAIDKQMFIDANGEFIMVFGKIEPFLPQLRAAYGNPGFLANLEWLLPWRLPPLHNFTATVRHGRTRDGRVYMPPFDGVLSQEAVWSIKTYLESRRVQE